MKKSKLRWTPLGSALHDNRLDPVIGPIRFEHDHITVQVPTTVIWGEADTALLPTLLDGLGAWVPRLKLVRVAEASHWILHEQPLRVRQEIEAALAR